MVLDHLSEEVEEECRQLLLKLVKSRFWLYHRHTFLSWAGHVWHWNVIVALDFFGARWKTRRKRYVIFIFVWEIESELILDTLRQHTFHLCITVNFTW